MNGKFRETIEDTLCEHSIVMNKRQHDTCAMLFFGVRFTSHIAIRDIVYTATVQVLIMVMIPTNKALIIPAMYGFLVVL